MKLLVTGATGLIGSRFCELLGNRYTIAPLGSRELDITNENAVKEKLRSTEFDTLIHFAAYTNVDLAEKERERAYAINVTGTKNLYSIAVALGKKFIHISTDFVFDGLHPPYNEMSTPNPLSYYAQTKFEAEEIVKEHATIVRISYPYGVYMSGKKDFVQRIKDALEKKTLLKMSSDSAMTPTFIDDIVNGLKILIRHDEAIGLYHLAGSQSLSPYEAGKLIATHFNLDPGLIMKTTLAIHTEGRAPRPQYNIVKSLHPLVRMRSFEEGLESL